jgi:hypothetical protein
MTAIHWIPRTIEYAWSRLIVNTRPKNAGGKQFRKLLCQSGLLGPFPLPRLPAPLRR